MQHAEFSLLEGMESVPTGQKFVHSPPTKKNPPTNAPLPPILPFLLNNNFSVVVAPIPFFFNFILFYTQIMLILILIHVQYLKNLVFSLKQLQMVKVTSQQILTIQWKNTCTKIFHPFTERGISPPTPLMLFGKPWYVSPFYHELYK